MREDHCLDAASLSCSWLLALSRARDEGLLLGCLLPSTLLDRYGLVFGHLLLNELIGQDRRLGGRRLKVALTSHSSGLLRTS